MSDLTPAELEQALRPYRDDILRFSRDLVAIASENPPGKLYEACFGRIGEELQRLGLAYEVFDAPSTTDGGERRANVVSFVGSGQPVVYFHGHYDVVPAQHQTQFQPYVEDGYLYGRGSTDMKAGLAAMMYAAFVLHELNIPLKGRIGLCFVADEETGGEGGSRYLEEIGVLGQDGIAMLTMEPTSGVVWNANRGAITLKVTTKGKSAHVGLQHQGINAFEQMLKVATELQALKAEIEPRRTLIALSHRKPPTPSSCWAASCKGEPTLMLCPKLVLSP